MLLDERPDLLAALYQGWYDGFESFWRQTLPPKMSMPQTNLSQDFVPYYCSANGLLSFHSSLFANLAAKERDEAVPPILEEALAEIENIATRPGVAAWFVLQPGEMAFWQNYTVMHARRRFEDAPGRERVLMRLWMNAHESRAVSPLISKRAQAVELILTKSAP
jgi:hypothetical protein